MLPLRLIFARANHRGPKGLTLLEILISLALLGSILGLGIGIFGVTTRSFTMGQLQSSLQQSARFADLILKQELRNTLDFKREEREEASSLPRSLFLEGETLYYGVDASIQLAGVEDILVSLVEEDGRIFVIYRIEQREGLLLENRILLNNIWPGDVDIGSFSLKEYVINYRLPRGE